MPLTEHTEPLTAADRKTAEDAVPDPRAAGPVQAPVIVLILGIIATGFAFSIIGSNALAAAVLLIGGTIVSVVSAFTLRIMWFYRKSLQKGRAEFERALTRGRARAREFTADAAWEAPSIEEHCSAVLLRVDPSRFAYCCMPWVDEAGRGSEDAPQFPATTRFVTLDGVGDAVLRVEHSGPSLPVRDELLAHDAPGAVLDVLQARAGDGFGVLNLDELPESWVTIVSGAAEPA